MLYLSLGASHDGSPGSYDCPASNNFIMTPATGIYTSNLLNYQKFSNCSIFQLKKLLLTKNAK